MSENIYDDPEFFSGYSRLPRSVDGLDGAPEWPALRALVPILDGKRVIDLGCGFGWFCRWARTAGASAVLGVDGSERMLERALADTDDAAIDYQRADLEAFDVPTTAFDVAYSSLTLHYLRDLPRLVRTIHDGLSARGTFVCSVEHPIYTAPTAPKWITGDSERPAWPIDRYLDEGPRTTDWIAEGVVKQHRTIATYVTTLIRAGFALSHLEEWGPTDAQVSEHPEWALERERPMFLLLAATRN